MFDLEKKAFFYESVNDIVRDTRYTIIAAAINKQAYINKYKDTYDVYGIALEFIMERTVFKLDEFTGNPELHVMVEKRGDKEDKKLRSQYDLLLSEGTRFIDTKRLNVYFKSFDFQCKKDNNCGLEFTDLVAYPIARHVIDTDKVNLAYDVLKDKIYTRNGKMYGLKTFPI